jgi:hypothetical protein
MTRVLPNLALERSAKRRCRLVPVALRAPASVQLYCWADNDYDERRWGRDTRAAFGIRT